MLSVFSWTEGSYTLKLGDLPTQELITLKMNTGDIMMDGIRRIRYLVLTGIRVAVFRKLLFAFCANALGRRFFSRLNNQDGDQTDKYG